MKKIIKKCCPQLHTEIKSSNTALTALLHQVGPPSKNLSV